MNSPKVQRCLNNATYCEQKAAAANERDIKLTFQDAASHWRELAWELRLLEQDSQPDSRKIAGHDGS